MAGQYMALPPDVNSALLEAGAGEAQHIAAGNTWLAVGGVLDAAVANLTGAVATLSGGWTGASGVTTVASTLPHISTLAVNAANAHAIGARHIAFAEAFRAAYLATPRLAHVEANQTEHVALQATNFMGINAMPIAINRGVYHGMWVDAGTAMNTYDALGTAASAPLPATPPPPITSGTGVELAAMGVSMGLQLGAGAVQGAMNVATTGLGAFSGVSSGVASSTAPAAQGMGAHTGGNPGGAPGQQSANPATAPKGDDPAQKLMPLLSQGAQAVGQVPQALGSSPSALTSAGQGPVQALMGPLQSLMSGGSGLGGTPASAAGLNGLGGFSGMYPGGLAAGHGGGEPGGRSSSKSIGLMRSAGLGGGSGYSMPSGWRTTADALGIGTNAATGVGSGRPVAGGAGLGNAAAGGMGPMLGPAAMGGTGGGRGSRKGNALSWEEDPFGADEEDDLPMVLTASGERGI